MVVLNTTDYLREGYRQVSDEKFYKELEKDPTNEIGLKIKETLISMRQVDFLSEKKS